MNELKFITETDWEKWRIETFYAKEPETIAWIRDFENDCVFWDIGANIGIYSLFCAFLHNRSRVHAFEPVESSFLHLRENARINGIMNIVAHCLCISDNNGVAQFSCKTDIAGSSGGQLKFNGTGNYAVPVFNCDTLCQYFEHPNHIKIDTDGNEFDILNGMYDLLRGDVLKSVLVEINGNHDSIGKWMSDAGFEPDEKYNKLKDRESDENVIFRRKDDSTE